jgi:hypothetical protein
VLKHERLFPGRLGPVALRRRDDLSMLSASRPSASRAARAFGPATTSTRRKSALAAGLGAVCQAAVALAIACSFLIWLVPQFTSPALAATTPLFVQEKDKQVISGTTNAVTFASATTAGNLNCCLRHLGSRCNRLSFRYQRKHLRERGGPCPVECQ